MEDKELYDFFKSRAPSFDEAPGDDLWAKIEDGLEETPQAPADKAGLSVFKKLLILPVLGVAIALIWMVAYDPEAGEGTTKPQDTGVTGHEGKKEKIVEDTYTHDKYSHTDTVKQVKLPVFRSGAVATAPAPKALKPASTAKGTTGFQPGTVKTGIVATDGSKPSQEMLQVNDIENTKLKLTDNIVFKPQNVVYGEKLIEKESLTPQAISFRGDSIEKGKLPEREFEVITVSSSAVRQGLANEVLLTPVDSLKSDLKVIQTDTKTEPGRVTITIKQVLTKAEFNSFTEKVKKESNHKAGTVITIIAPGYKPFRYKVPKPVGELGP